MQVAADSYHQDRWENQHHRVFVVVEKDALSGVLGPVCHDLDVPLLASRGYPSVTVIRDFAVNQIDPALRASQHVVVLHLADHDPSGIDMTRDLEDRLSLFIPPSLFDVGRIALNMDQIEQLNPPENPAKQSDCRYAEYARQFGNAS